MNEVKAHIASKALIIHGIMCIFPGTGIFTIWSPLSYKISSKLSHDGKRVRGEIGILKKATMDSPIAKITSVKINQGIIGRIFNYGTIRINLSGDIADYCFKYVDNPSSFKDSLFRTMDAK